MLLTDDRHKILTLYGILHSKKEVAKAMKIPPHILKDKCEKCFIKWDDEEEDEKSESLISNDISDDNNGEANGNLSISIMLIS